MANYLRIPFITPIKVYQCKQVAGAHFDDDWSYNQIKLFERKVFYYRKWKRVEDTTPFQIRATQLPSAIKVLDCSGAIKKSIDFTQKLAGSLGYNIYEAVIDIDDLPDGIYYLYSKTQVLTVYFEFISEPIHLKSAWPNTLSFEYYNSVNDFDVTFITGLKYKFRCEAGIMDFQPESDAVDYVDQLHNVELLSAVPFRTFKLYIADEKGVAGWVLDVLNRLFCCDKVIIQGKEFIKPASNKWEINRQKGYPLFGASIEIVEAENLTSLQITSIGDALVPALVAGYNIETDFFGNSTGEIKITDIQTLPE